MNGFINECRLVFEEFMVSSRDLTLILYREARLALGIVPDLLSDPIVRLILVMAILLGVYLFLPNL